MNSELQKSFSSKSLLYLKNPFEVEGLFPSHSEDPFAEKPFAYKGFNSSQNFVLSNIGISCRKGLKEELNQDNFFVFSKSQILVAGVFDGHGENGHIVSSLAKKFLRQNLITDLEIIQNPPISIRSSFVKTQEKIVQKFIRAKNDCLSSGCSTMVAVVNNSSLYIAHIGNCKAFIAKRVQGNLMVTPLTSEHNIDNPDEKSRILSVSCHELLSVQNDKKNCESSQNSLKLTRSFGNTGFLDLGMISDPFIYEMKLVGDENSVIICSEGVWKYVNMGEMSNILTENNCENACNVMENLAWSRWIEKYNDFVEDMTVIVIPL
ncbi:hypothetical protein SteCoe_34105 [Stentor coeruleus]|uniref:PPM-type phosphatase domain-containing protein n=1 Tax=Stentor coeruleus TaxID=5963 RepID=A0A1R2AV67_9CILI|nr:hypothetical protein SteCoe_34105 [Stentor coeruleus]